MHWPSYARPYGCSSPATTLRRFCGSAVIGPRRIMPIATFSNFITDFMWKNCKLYYPWAAIRRTNHKDPPPFLLLHLHTRAVRPYLSPKIIIIRLQIISIISSLLEERNSIGNLKHQQLFRVSTPLPT